MARMEFLKENVLNTTTMITSSTGTGTFGYLFDRSLSLKYSTVGHTSNTATEISIAFASPTVINTVLVRNHNLKQFRAYVNGVTATSVNYSSNSETSTYISFGSVTVNSVQIELEAPMTADTEMQIGEFVVTERRLQFPNNPTSNDFKPIADRTQIVHKMPDGGVSVFNITNKYKAKIKLDFISTSFHTSLRSVFNEAAPMYFLPYPTASAWDGVAHEVAWTGDFNFNYSENSKTQGFDGEIVIEETSNA